MKQGCLSRSRVSAVLFVAVSLSSSGWAQVHAATRSTVADPDAIPSLSIPAEVPLRLEITHTITLKTGELFQGRLTEPVYGPNRLLLPAGTAADGVISATPAADRGTRVNAKLDGDFTPLRVPVIRVTQLVLSPSGAVLPVDAVGGMRNAATITLGAHRPPSSIKSRVKAMIHQQIQQVRDMIHNPHKGDWAKQLLYSQLPYHPQRVWAGSQFDAVLREPLRLPLVSASAPIPTADAVDLTSGNMQARLTAGISSATSKKGDPVSAVLVKPFCNPQGSLMLPAGTSLNGVVLQARPARSFARNGRLRFSFRSVGTPGPSGAGQRIESGLASIQGQKGQNVALDEEGGTHAKPDKGRFLAPLVLGVMAAASQDDDAGIARQGVTSNGFGLAARIVTMATASRDASTGFAVYAFGKSIYRRYIATGHQVSFPTNTELSINLSGR
ncbi:MAG TPA: hypothetical protein VGG59_07700 [Acidobacteriaceae bacterium]